MNNLTQFLQNVRNQSGFKARLRKKLFGSMLSGFDAVNADLIQQQTLLEECRAGMDEISSQLQNISAQLRNLDEKANADITILHKDLENASINLQNNNSIIESLSSDTEYLKLRLSGIQQNMTKPTAAAVQNSEAQPIKAVPAAEAESDYESIDYFDFENHFRGSIDSIKKSQEFYLKYFRDKKNVVDIGCGRGEFLSLLKDNGISAKGVDIYPPYVDYCNMKGLSAVCGDGSQFLSGLDCVDGIFVGQVVEHLEVHEIIRLCNTAYEKLSSGGCIVIETPNPTSLAIYTNAFYIDPSHVKPVHPLTMKYYLEKAGFRNIEIIYTETSRADCGIPELKVQNAEQLDEFNKSMKRVSELLFGSQDYAVIAVK